jgi:hypothetical protein
MDRETPLSRTGIASPRLPQHNVPMQSTKNEMNYLRKEATWPALFCGAAITLVLAGCAQLPQPVAELPWKDLWGDRGAGVLARDYEMCESLVEQRRGLLEGCMAARGWLVRSTD